MLREAKPFDRLKIKLEKAKFKQEVQLCKAQRIVDIPRFIKSHVSALEGQAGNKLFIPYYERLIELLKNKL